MQGRPLPKRRFGVEIEFLLPYRKPDGMALSMEMVMAHLKEAGVKIYEGKGEYYAGWSYGFDGGCLALGWQHVELRSRILKGEEGLAEVRKVMGILQSYGAMVGVYDGMHVHIERKDLSDAQLRRWFAAYTRYERCIDQLVAPRRHEPHNYAGYGVAKYLPSIKGAKMIRDGEGRYHYSGYFNPRGASLGTVELRQHQGCIDGARATNWIALMLYLCDTSTRQTGGIINGDNLIDGDTDQSFQLFLQCTGAPKSLRDYWMSERKRLAEGGDEPMPEADATHAKAEWRETMRLAKLAKTQQMKVAA